ncbi:hypothetical protein [Mucilaginibacter sp.]|uniref:hypothetical protein n=1 Tax=Mucilaginibacter sp. TaxID=1882438 RepID=UPI0035BC4F01
MKKSIIIVATALFNVLLLTGANLALAQDAPIMALDPTLMAGWSGNLAYGNTWGKASTSVKSSFPYKSTLALRQSVVESFTKRLQSQSPKGAEAVSAAFGPGKGDYGTLYTQMLKSSALHDNDAADALAGLILVGYQIVNNVSDNQVNSTMERSLRGQIAGIIGKNAKMSSPASRARVSEELKLQTVVLALGLQETLRNNTVVSYRNSIAKMFQNQYHLNLLQLNLTNKGFVKK